jgi:hypothetical protein
MKKSILLVLGVTSILTSCLVTKEVTPEPVVSESELVQVNTTVILPGQVDTNPLIVSDTIHFNTYRVIHIATGQYQILSYGTYFNMWSIEDSTKVRIVDTLQYRVHWNDLGQ